MGHSNFRAQTKKIAGTWKYFRAAYKFPRTINKFPRIVNKFPQVDLIFLRKLKCLRTHINVLGTNNIYLGDYNFSAHMYKYFRAQDIFPRTLFICGEYFLDRTAIQPYPRALQPFAKRLALPDSEINKAHQKPNLRVWLILAHPPVTGPLIIIGSV